MAATRLTVYMNKGDPHVLDFKDEDSAKAALQEVHEALGAAGVGGVGQPVTIAERLVVNPSDVRSAELGEPPSFGIA